MSGFLRFDSTHDMDADDHGAAAAQFVSRAPFAFAWHLVLDRPYQLGEPGVSQVFMHPHVSAAGLLADVHRSPMA